MSVIKGKLLKEQLFRFSPGMKVYFLKSLVFPGHLGMKISSQGKEIIAGFYPKNGEIYSSSLCAKDGELWIPDPYLKNDVEVLAWSTILNQRQADILNRIICGNSAEGCKTTCKHHKGSTGHRLQCSTTNKYKILPLFENQFNCRTFLYDLFPGLEENMSSVVADRLGF
jgi:hypothetical protein